MPGAPTNVAVSNIGPRSVTLQFRPGYDGKTSISRWQVEAQVREQDSVVTILVYFVLLNWVNVDRHITKTSITR